MLHVCFCCAGITGVLLAEQRWCRNGWFLWRSFIILRLVPGWFCPQSCCNGIITSNVWLPSVFFFLFFFEFSCSPQKLTTGKANYSCQKLIYIHTTRKYTYNRKHFCTFVEKGCISWGFQHSYLRSGLFASGMSFSNPTQKLSLKRLPLCISSRVGSCATPLQEESWVKPLW